jgi:hypothetical protein
MSTTRSITLHATCVAAAFLVTSCLSPMGRAQNTAETEVRTHITVTQHDLTAAGNVKAALFHAMEAQVPGAKARVAALHAENAQRAAELGIDPIHTAVNAVLTSPYFYPADLKKGTGPTLAKTTMHALYVDYAGTVAANWGNPEQFLKDLNVSTFVHLLDQYTATTAINRYPVGGNAAISYGFYGNVLYEHDMWAIAHAAAVKYGAGTGHLYHIFLPKGLDTCFDLSSSCYSPDNNSTWAFCAYHSSVTFSDIGTVLFSVEPYQNVPGCAVQTPSPNGQLADSTNSVLSHETFEAITDPEAGSGYLNRVSLDLNGYEIGDECQPLVNSASDFLVPTFKINGKNYEVQLEYSNTYHACAAQP